MLINGYEHISQQQDSEGTEEEYLEATLEDMAAEQIPKAFTGEPEAGLQPDFFGGSERVFPRGRGEVTQISMDDLLKLENIKNTEGKI